jgi:hypothetical protein
MRKSTISKNSKNWWEGIISEENEDAKTFLDFTPFLKSLKNDKLGGPFPMPFEIKNKRIAKSYIDSGEFSKISSDEINN